MSQQQQHTEPSSKAPEYFIFNTTINNFASKRPKLQSRNRGEAKTYFRTRIPGPAVPRPLSPKLVKDIPLFARSKLSCRTLHSKQQSYATDSSQKKSLIKLRDATARPDAPSSEPILNKIDTVLELCDAPMETLSLKDSLRKSCKSLCPSPLARTHVGKHVDPFIETVVVSPRAHSPRRLVESQQQLR